MSIKLMAEAWGTSGLTASQKLVLLAFCDYANDDGTCYPSIPKMADKCDMKDRNLQYNISSLTKAGFLSVEERFKGGKWNTSNLYKINLPNFAPYGAKDCTPPGAKDCTLDNHHINHQKDILLSDSSQQQDLMKTEDNSFEKFWASYPRKTAKANAKKIWGNKKYSQHTISIIMTALETQTQKGGCLELRKDVTPPDKFIPHAATWLNQDRFLDEMQCSLGYTPLSEYGYIR